MYRPMSCCISTRLTPVEPEPDPGQLGRGRQRFLICGARPDRSRSELRLRSGRQSQRQVRTSLGCKGCYRRVQQKADLLEAALHIDLKEAAPTHRNPAKPTRM